MFARLISQRERPPPSRPRRAASLTLELPPGFRCAFEMMVA